MTNADTLFKPTRTCHSYSYSFTKAPFVSDMKLDERIEKKNVGIKIAQQKVRGTVKGGGDSQPFKLALSLLPELYFR